MAAKPSSIVDYLDSLPEDRRGALLQVMAVIRQNLPEGYEEGMQYGMVGYYVPHRLYPAGYHTNPKEPLPFLSLASQKNHMALYLFCVYTASSEEAFRQAWKRSGKKLDMGKSCVRFKKVDDLALDVIGEWIRAMPVPRFVAAYEASRLSGQ
ncbi:MAG: DUF1801 domain-containing protein [Bryobacterales bacterium]|jgi:hypothetical protein|nr:DUF1801 domain-containing protein [Bryobacterales bacterium]